MPGDCPSGGSHNWENTAETETHVTHTCKKCGATNTRPKGSRAANLACLAVAVVIFLATLVPIFLAGRASP